MKLDVRTILLLRHPDGRQVLLLCRSPEKKLFPNLMTGIGGAVELASGEGADLEAAVLRELEEETRIRRDQICACVWPPRSPAIMPRFYCCGIRQNWKNFHPI